MPGAVDAADQRPVDPAAPSAAAGSPGAWRRRQLLARAAALPAWGWAAAAGAHANAGRVQPPLPAPALPLRLHDGRRSSLPALLAGRRTAVQLMFTGCTATCPLQGALFAAVQAGLADQGLRGAGLLSISVDALGDHPAALQAWLQRQGAVPPWRAAVPDVAGVERLFDFLDARREGADTHTAQVYIFDAHAALVLRSTDFPSPQQVLGWLRRA